MNFSGSSRTVLLCMSFAVATCFSPQPNSFSRHNVLVCPRKRTVLFGTPGNGKDPKSDSKERQKQPTSSFQGAGIPRPELPPGEIPSLLMDALLLNDFPQVDAGLTSMWAFAGETTRHIFQQNMTEFIESAHETADLLPTSFYGAAMYGKSWVMETKVNRVGGKEGWIATQVMKTISSDGRLRRWQWELRKNRRPPCLGCWFVESIGSSDRKGQFEAE